MRKASSAASAANAIVDHMRSWLLGTEEVCSPSFSFFFFFFCLFCFVLFCFVLFCFVLFCFVLFCFVLFQKRGSDEGE